MSRMMIRHLPRVVVLAIAVVLGLALVATASADTPPGRGPNGSPTPTPPAGDCAVLRVQLNGRQPATSTCLAGGQDMQSALPSTTNCISSDLQIFQDTNFGGRKLCFYGSGYARLNEYSLYSGVPFLNWGDRMSSFKTGQFYVDFYEHTNGGARIRYASWQSRSSMPSGWNDRVSAICIYGPNITC